MRASGSGLRRGPAAGRPDLTSAEQRAYWKQMVSSYMLQPLDQGEIFGVIAQRLPAELRPQAESGGDMSRLSNWFNKEFKEELSGLLCPAVLAEEQCMQLLLYSFVCQLLLELPEQERGRVERSRGMRALVRTTTSVVHPEGQGRPTTELFRAKMLCRALEIDNVCKPLSLRMFCRTRSWDWDFIRSEGEQWQKYKYWYELLRELWQLYTQHGWPTGLDWLEEGGPAKPVDALEALLCDWDKVRP